jgi:hypothetical protein
MKLLAIASLAVAVGFVSATCPNLCNGHGTCGTADRCTCFGNWQGADCSERVCNYGLAWVDAPSATDTAHWYAECSNKGICDRSTGLCECYEGYTGKGCRRSTCPNDCSGHGTCYYIEQLSNSNGKFAVDYSNMQTMTTWDKSKIQACVCDPYYEGTDCSLRQCPRGDNILTLDQISTVQEIDIKDAATAALPTGQYTLTFTDLYGGEWTTRPLTLPPTTTFAAEVEAELKKLPNNVIESISCVDGSTTSLITGSSVDISNYGYSAKCTFTGDQNAGVQNLIKLNQKGCKRAGCTPYYNGITNLVTTTTTVDLTNNAAYSTEASPWKEAKVCSEHGLCDTETGLCECFSGYFDEDCSKQTVLV